MKFKAAFGFSEDGIWLSVRVVPFAILVITVPAGMPCPFTVSPTASPAVLETVIVSSGVTVSPAVASAPTIVEVAAPLFVYKPALSVSTVPLPVVPTVIVFPPKYKEFAVVEALKVCVVVSLIF